MEQNFQTSFIPKKPIVESKISRSAPIGFFTIISLLVLFTVVLTTGYFYFRKKVLSAEIEKSKNNLRVAKTRFEPERIIELQLLDKRLLASSDILSKHIAVTPIFKALQDITLKSVRYTQFSYSLGEKKGEEIMVKMTGVALGYKPIALQSDLYAKNRNLIDPVFSNLTLGEKGEVTFDLNFSVDPNFVDYKKNLPEEEPTL